MTKWNHWVPPHVGWWQTKINIFSVADVGWRWWNGVYWSKIVFETDSAEKAAAQAKLASVFDLKQTVWSYYWPEHARVPRVDPYKRRVRKPNIIMESR